MTGAKRWARHRRLAAFLAAAISCAGGVAIGQQQGQAQSALWEFVAERPAQFPQRNLAGAALLRLDIAALDAVLRQAPPEGVQRSSLPVILVLPLADGTLARFRVADSPVVTADVAAAFPEVRTLIGQGLDDPTATARLGWTATGFHATIISATGTTHIDPYAPGITDFYVVAAKGSVQRPSLPFICEVPGSDLTANRVINEFPIANGTTLRTYRLALAATGEYTAAAGGTKLLALSRMVATINRVNGIYERELAVRFMLLTGNPSDPTALIYTNGSTDPYSNTNGGAMLSQNQATIDTVVGNANYDFGHVFSTGGGGVASLGSVCQAGVKARGVTGSSNPIGDGFDVDYVAHEVGHQFGGSHTFNGTSVNCGGGNRSGAHAAEVGSGSTIQAYAGICGAENLQPHSDDYFTFESLNEMTAFITSGAGGSCGAATATGNTIPTVSAGASHVVPVNTPFTLTASASDADGDAITFNWEQWSLNGTPSNSVVSASTDSGTNPLVRSYLPATNPSRTVPKLTYVLGNGNTPPMTYACATGACLTGEVLPATDRTIVFHVTVRDNRAGAGAIASSSMSVTSSTAAGPFSVTSPNTAVTLTGGSVATVAWNVANTAAFPVGAANVRILLSTDGGATFATVLSASTPNDGSHSVTIPNSPTTAARVMVAAVGNIFFDVSNSNFTIVSAPTLQFTDDPLVSQVTPLKVVHVAELRTAIEALRARFGLSAVVWTDATIVAGATEAKAAHVLELRSALQGVYSAAGLTPPTYSRPVLTPRATIIAVADIAELRAAVRAVW